jgi:hypothetical protein
MSDEVRAEIAALENYGYRTADIQAELIVAQADQIIAQEAIA